MTAEDQVGRERWALAGALYAHIDNCSQCAGVDDGCEHGRALEWMCMDRLDFDPWEEPYRKLDSRVPRQRTESEEDSK